MAYCSDANSALNERQAPTYRRIEMTDIKIERELTPTKGRYVATIDGVEGEAELTFSRASPVLVIADHTLAPDSMRGMGAAKAMVDRLIADARSEGFKIFALCPYVKSQFDRHPEWADIKAS
jgi:predicted GNAT family acetyltransferase